MRSRLIVVATVLAFFASDAGAMDLLDVWRAALQHDLEFSAADAAHQAGEARRDQGASLWRPTVQFTGTAGRMSSESATTGAQFSAPRLPANGRRQFQHLSQQRRAWSLDGRGAPAAHKSGAPRAQSAIGTVRRHCRPRMAGRQTNADAHYGTELLRSRARRRIAAYPSATKGAVERELVEARDRHKLGDIPVTDTYEASARVEAIRRRCWRPRPTCN